MLLKPDLIALIKQCYDSILKSGLGFHESRPSPGKGQAARPPAATGRNSLMLRLSNRKPDVVRCQ